MNKIIAIAILQVFAIECLMCQSTTVEKSPFSIGESLEMQSSILQEKRILNVYLPDSYGQDSSKTYPVIYLLDGSRDEDFIHISGLVQFCTFPWIETLPESIVVGIGNVDRRRDFTYPTKIKDLKQDFPTSGGSAKFIKYLEQEVQPLINNTYQVDTLQTLIGQSLGGLLATEILMQHPHLFDNYIIISPSLWWDDESLLGLPHKAYYTNKKVYVGVGKEGEIMERVAESLHQKISIASSDNEHVFFSFFEKRNHGDALHEAVYDAFEKLFNKKGND